MKTVKDFCLEPFDFCSYFVKVKLHYQNQTIIITSGNTLIPSLVIPKGVIKQKSSLELYE